MTLLVWIVLGIAFGWLASRIASAETLRGRLVHVAVGIAGALGGGLLNALFSAHPEPYLLSNVDNWATAVMGASLLLFLSGRRMA